MIPKDHPDFVQVVDSTGLPMWVHTPTGLKMPFGTKILRRRLMAQVLNTQCYLFNPPEWFVYMDGDNPWDTGA
jgi:hypothetical protein